MEKIQKNSFTYYNAQSLETLKFSLFSSKTEFPEPIS
jgi:hypothetical protein